MGSSEKIPCCPPEAHPPGRADELGPTQPQKGEIVKLNGTVRAYVVHPQSKHDSKRGAVIVFHDIFGFDSARTHNFCDELAMKGDYLVVAPDCFGESVISEPRELASMRAVRKFPTMVSRYKVEFDYVERVIDMTVIPFIRQFTQGNVGAVGFCWGSWAILRTASRHGRLSCGVCAHPTVHQQIFQKNGPDMETMFRDVKAPILFCPAWNDPASFREDGYYFKLLKQAQTASKCVLFNDQLHGFANRADLKDAKNRAAYEKFFGLTLDFLNDNIDGPARGVQASMSKAAMQEAAQIQHGVAMSPSSSSQSPSQSTTKHTEQIKGKL